MSLITSYTSANKIINRGKTQRITCAPAGDPVPTVIRNISTDEVEISVDQWYEMECHSTASFSYVGMDYTTASTCAAQMRSKFTREKSVWKYQAQQDSTRPSLWILGWVECDDPAVVQEAEINLSHQGGHMYRVDVNVDCSDIKYVKDPSSTTFSYPSCFSDVD